MFNLETSVVAWRSECLQIAKLDAETLAELEDHLREEFASECASGSDEAGAWSLAIERLGNMVAMAGEYDKITRMTIVDRVAFGGLTVATCLAAGILAFAVILRSNAVIEKPLIAFHVILLSIGYSMALLVATAAAYRTLKCRMVGRTSVAVDATVLRWIRWGSATAAVTTCGALGLGELWLTTEQGRELYCNPRAMAAILVVAISCVAAWRARRSPNQGCLQSAVPMAVMSGGVVTAAWFGLTGVSRGDSYGFFNWPLAMIGFGGMIICFLIAAMSLRQSYQEVEIV